MAISRFTTLIHLAMEAKLTWLIIIVTSTIVKSSNLKSSTKTKEDDAKTDKGTNDCPINETGKGITSHV